VGRRLSKPVADDAAISYAKGQGRQFEMRNQRRKSGEFAFADKDKEGGDVPASASEEYEWEPPGAAARATTVVKQVAVAAFGVLLAVIATYIWTTKASVGKPT
jgi:hypothetical protein